MQFLAALYGSDDLFTSMFLKTSLELTREL